MSTLNIYIKDKPKEMKVFHTLISSLSFVLIVRGWSIQLPLDNKQQYMSRRLFTFVTVASPCCIVMNNPNVVHALDERLTKSFVKGTVTLKSDIALPPEQRTNSALYITARPQQVDNVPKAILDGSNGKPPPVLATRISNPTFPLDFDLSTADLTPEGSSGSLSDSTPSSPRYWFEGNELIISARWDTDGVAMTRDPTDLVGRSISKQQKDVSIELTGRGFTGKLVTGKSKK